MADWPTVVRTPLVEAHLRPDWFKVGFLEASNTDVLYRELREAGPLPPIPMIVLCSMGVDDFRRAVAAGQSEDQLHLEIAGRLRLYEHFTRSVPGAQVWPVESVGHLTLHLRRPDAVVAAISEVLGATRH